MPEPILIPGTKQFRYRFRNFSRGMIRRGPLDTTYTKTDRHVDDGAVTLVSGGKSLSGLVEPTYGPLAWNSTNLLATGSGAAEAIFPYALSSTSASLIRLVVREHGGGTRRIYDVPAGGPGAGIAMDTVNTMRSMTQYRPYVYIAGNNAQPYRYRIAGTTPQLSFAGTPPPGGSPTLSAGGAGGTLSIGTYTYYHAYKYGIAGELGMGWQLIGTVAVTAGQVVTISSLATAAPASYGDLYASCIYRSTIISPNRAFLTIEDTTPNTSYVDGDAAAESDASIEGGEELDPIEGTAGLPPKFRYCIFHKNRLYGFYVVDGTNIYATRNVWSRISSQYPFYLPDQFDEFAVTEIGKAEDGIITGAASWGGSLFAFQKHAISYLAQEPDEFAQGIGRGAKWAPAVSGLGMTAERSLGIAPFGMFFVSAEGPSFWPGQGQVIGIGDDISSELDPSTFEAAVGGYNPRTQDYEVSFGTSKIYRYNLARQEWTIKEATVSFGCCATVDDELYFHTSDTTSDRDLKLWRSDAGSLGRDIDGNGKSVIVYTPFTDLGFDQDKKLSEVRVTLTRISAASTTVACAVHFNGSSSSTISKTTSLTTGRTFAIRAPENTRHFHTVQARITLGTSAPEEIIESIEFIYEVDEDRRMHDVAA